MNEKQDLSSQQIQARLKNLQHSANQRGPESRDVDITVATQRDGFNLSACQALLEENGISCSFVGRGFHQVAVVPREASGRAFDIIAAHRESLVQANPLTAGDFVVGVVAWSFCSGLFIPAAIGLTLFFCGVRVEIVLITAAIIMAISVVVGGVLGFLRCRAIASRPRK